MADMNVKGGYVAPSNYLKVNAGGSHDENPNGGVQIGVDQNGTPNMLEEGEPVYNDFVYSDNIQADLEFLEKHNLPKKYAGWLYSEIADDLFNARTEMPLDAMEENGAEVMLTRLAECQEEQKQVAEQRELERMLAELTSEEQDALMQMMAQEAQQPSPEEMAMAQQQVIPQEQMPVEQAPMQMSPEQMALPGQMPVMAACGGHINRYDKGGPTKEEQKRIDAVTEAVLAQADLQDAYRYGMTGEAPLAPINPIADLLTPVGDLKYSGIALKDIKDAISERDYLDALKTAGIAAGIFLLPEGIDAGLKGLLSSSGRAIRRGAKRGVKETEQKIRKKLYDDIVDEGEKIASRRGDIAKDVSKATSEIEESSATLAKKLVEDASRERPLSGAAKTARENSINNLRKSIEDNSELLKSSKKKARNEWWDEQVNGLREFDANVEYRLAGGNPSAKTSSTPATGADGGFKNWWKRNRKAAAWTTGTVAGVGAAGLTALQMIRNANSIKHGAPVDYKGGVVTREGSYPNNYIPNQDVGIEIEGPSAAPTIDALIDTTGLTEREGTIMIPPALRIKANGGPVNRFEKAGPINRTLPTSFVYAEGKPMPQFDMWAPFKKGLNIRPGKPHLAPISIDDDYDSTMDLLAQRDADFMAGYNPEYPDINIDAPDVASSQNGQRMLSTLGRDIVPATEAGIGLYDAFQPADKITAQRANANLISGNMRLIDPRLRQYDINQTVNRVTNQNNALASQIRNSGAGPSTMAGLIAADYNGAINVGNAVAQDRLLNEQAYNTALSGYNNNESARAQFNLSRDARNQAMLDAAQRTNIQNNLFEQQANNQYESQKWASVGNQVQRALDAMYANATSNFNMNMVNSNPAFENYGISPYGWVNYMAAQAARNKEAQKIAEQSGYSMTPSTVAYSLQPTVPSYYGNRYMPDFADEFNKYARASHAKLSPEAQIGLLRSCGGYIGKTKK